jgi:hypothetical protein
MREIVAKALHTIILQDDMEDSPSTDLEIELYSVSMLNSRGM